MNKEFKKCPKCFCIIGNTNIQFECKHSPKDKCKITRQFYKCNLCGYEEEIPLIPNHTIEPIEEKKMNLEEATKLKTELINKGFDTIIFDPKKEIRISMEYEVIVRGIDENFVREKEESQCEMCFNFKEKMTGKMYSEFCKKRHNTVPADGENCPDFIPKYGTLEKNENTITQAFLEKHVDLVIRKTLIVSARDLLRKACKGADDPLYKVYRQLETDFIEHLTV